MNRMNRLARNISRTIFFAGGIATAGTAYMLFEAQWLSLNRRRIDIPELPPALTGLRILHVSDLHAGGSRLNNRLLTKFARAVRDLEPDLILFTGDQSDKNRDLGPYVSLLASLEARYGKFAVLGNHDHGLRMTVMQDMARRLTGREKRPVFRMDAERENVRRNRNLLAEAGICLLDNECIREEICAEMVQICGIDDFQYRLADLPAVVRQVDRGAALRILLSHSPNAARKVDPDDFQLMLSGHTHGGQICLPSLRNGKTMLSTSGAEYGEGLFRLDGMVLHVSRGVGTTLVPLRLMSRPELVMLQLFPA
ncbi:MAG: metallophosphoesterase [Actinobacteria bacterium]|nr:metallophosphoesterase [Actinomycetota bacterium]